MSRGHIVWQFLQSVGALLLTVALSPLIVVVGEPLRRYVLARPVARSAWYRVPRQSGPVARVAMLSCGPAGTAQVSWRRHRFWMLLVSNPVWIALTAPARWLLDRGSGFGYWGRRGPPAAGVREPRRPEPGMPGGSIALAEPRALPVLVRLLGMASRGTGHRDDRARLGQRRRVRRAGGHRPA
jgi:hypothetical protein